MMVLALGKKTVSRHGSPGNFHLCGLIFSRSRGALLFDLDRDLFSL